MTTDVTTPPATEQRPAPRPRARRAGAEPKAVLTVPAKPAAITGANLASLGATAVAASGPVGVVVAGGVVATAGVGYLVRRVVVSRSAGGRSGSPRVVAGGGRRLPGSGGGSRGAGGRGATGGRSPRAGAGASGRGLTGGRAGGSPAGRSGSSGRGLLGRLAGRRSSGGAGSATRGGRSGAGAGTGSGSARKPGLARRLWNGAKAVRAGRRAAGASAGSSRPSVGSTAARRRLWGRMRKVMRRKVLGIPEKTTPAAKTTAPKRNTGDRVRRPAQEANPTQNQTRGWRPKPQPGQNSTNGRNPAMSNQTPPAPQQQGSSPFYAAARQVHATAASHKPRGMLARRLEAYEMPMSLGEIAAGLRLLAQTHTSQEPLDPAYAAAVMQIATTVDAAAQAARQLGPAFDGLHAVQVRRLLQPKPGEPMWDTVNNRP